MVEIDLNRRKGNIEERGLGKINLHTPPRLVEGVDADTV